MRIIPAIDIIDGKCVRLTKGDFNTKKIYNEDPLEVAKQFEGRGVQYLHLVDLDGAKEGTVKNHKILEKIAGGTTLTVDFGGGIKSEDDIKKAFEHGASQITGGSIAIKNNDLFLNWLKRYGPQKIVLGADVIDEHIAVSGWQETTERHVVPFIKYYQNEGIEYVICTDVNKDGMLKGPSVDLYEKILSHTNRLETVVSMSGVEDKKTPGIKLVASGGISGIGDLEILRKTGCEGVIIGKAIYEGLLPLEELEQYILST